MSIDEEINYFKTETDLSKQFTLYDANYLTQSSCSSKPSKLSFNIKNEINKFNAKINLSKIIKKKIHKPDLDKEFIKLGKFHIEVETIKLNIDNDFRYNSDKKLLDKNKIIKFKYMPTSISRSSNCLKKKILNPSLQLTAKPKMIKDYKLPPTSKTFFNLPITANTLYKVLKKSQKELYI